LCMYRFTLSQIGDLFIRLKAEGTQIRIITDNARDSIDRNQIPRMRANGIKVRESQDLNIEDDHARPLMHNKFVIIDNECCILGSFNWTFAGVTRNQESVIKSSDPNVVKPLVRAFNQMWNNLAA
jgi:phosphatidylserine/phosphatidylglycerophosphate/cardiolipin synthase-like enzyme